MAGIKVYFVLLYILLYGCDENHTDLVGIIGVDVWGYHTDLVWN
jgi:hypothetical protein